MNTFTCARCGMTGPSTEFAKDKQKSTGLSPYCSPCKRTLRNESAARHRATNRARSTRWYEKNAVRMAERAASPEAKRKKALYMREWRLAHPGYHEQYERKNKTRLRAARRISSKIRRDTDINSKLAGTLRGRLRSALKHNARKGSAVRDLGCSIPELRKYLESLFLPGMSWANWSPKGWHIDHIRPLASFDLTSKEQLIVAVNFRNLQPLWQHDNQSKDAHVRSAKLVTPATAGSAP